MFVKYICVVGFLLFTLSAYGQSFEEYRNLLRKVDTLLSFNDHDLSAEYTIRRVDPGGSVSTTVATVFRRDRRDQFTILILEPLRDRGKGYFRSGDNLWLFDPVSGGYTLTSARERFQNSSARNSDFYKSSYYEDYNVVSVRREMLGRFNCTVLDLRARHDRVSFPKVRLWICENNLVRKRKDFSLSGQLLRTTAIPSYQQVGNSWLPGSSARADGTFPPSITIIDHLVFRDIAGRRVFERTEITITQPSLRPQPDILFTKEFLERARN
ncbi:MAG: outer membrane lipoprotein-sorting protein [Spirochaetes bacterium]|nr:outer membrane lipoprotein-sorting protein [Spirochaetota bacterium]